MSEKPKSLLPYDDKYVLINKWTLLVNAATISAMSEFISKFSGNSPEAVAAIFGVAANEHLEGLTDEQISERANLLVANFWKLNQSQLVVQTDNPPISND
ncbi:hypothetical protein H6G54_00740 [Anabaena cylindrica FACHB-243]|uniref:Uncharacterized protein n=1 Tax=Anabaena cylindrica (strain ATCC 27899 / PCC 7122) TaxID=272123 RepID=K9ZJH8_ANACC|nr:MULTISPECIES: hypothetical protein [Anabaena]AFZ59393.1 hypothetical protein Anacy_4023 [Anabaena cylindrica PCC 7122]MBD2416263.1 hypothetical protein [Anabaena cylindrica FACHB-243]MBY5280226.1 hypothetical protein [Anabaena sp. CCAP 1446/1C]MBY5308498.1 hypothetical protein [Anabaena sp. CCAP 1446/1C]MCM2405311.1 hypothetical protein [Anabaena sp. CCAP 1446/1C]